MCSIPLVESECVFGRRWDGSRTSSHWINSTFIPVCRPTLTLPGGAFYRCVKWLRNFAALFLVSKNPIEGGNRGKHLLNERSKREESSCSANQHTTDNISPDCAVVLKEL